MRSNAAVGPPIEMIIAETGRPTSVRSIVFDEEGGYLTDLRAAWQANLRDAFESLPELPKAASASTIRLIDSGED
jgi:putative proteasome-type protease